MQKSASVHKRTSPLKFDHFRQPKSDLTASDLSTEVAAEEAAVKGFEELSTAKKQEIAAAGEAIESKTGLKGSIGDRPHHLNFCTSEFR